VTGPVLRPDLRPPAGWDRAVARWLGVAALLGVLVGAVITLTALSASGTAPEAPGSAWRSDYDRGWSWLVESQRRDPRPDELARAECRFWADGDGRDVVRLRAPFVAGCDAAARMTPLEAP
jgi:hypothetical protein